LRDVKGAEKGLWQVTSVGSEFMMAEGEKRKLFLLIDKTRSGLFLFDKRSKVRFQAFLSNDGDGKGEEEPVLFLIDKEGKSKVEIFVKDNGMPSMGFFDSSEKVWAVLGLSERGDPAFALYDVMGEG
jgi:hypothetical protein